MLWLGMESIFSFTLRVVDKKTSNVFSFFSLFRGIIIASSARCHMSRNCLFFRLHLRWYSQWNSSWISLNGNWSRRTSSRSFYKLIKRSLSELWNLIRTLRFQHRIEFSNGVFFFSSNISWDDLLSEAYHHPPAFNNCQSQNSSHFISTSQSVKLYKREKGEKKNYSAKKWKEKKIDKPNIKGCFVSGKVF